MKLKQTTKWVTGIGTVGLLLAQSAAAIEFKMPKIIDGWNPFGKKGIPLEIIIDARFPEVAKLNKIAVPTFKGQPGVDFTASLRDELSSAEVNNEKVFSLNGTLDSNTDSARSIVDQARRAGIDAVYIGETAVGGKRALPIQEDYCKGGVMVFGKCRGGEAAKRTCWTITGTFTANVQVLRTSDGNSVYEERKSESVEEKHCEDPSAMMIQPAELALKAKDKVIESIKADIMPRTETHRVQLMGNTKTLNKEDKERFLEARDWAKDKRLNRACGIWEELSENSKSAAENTSVIYNLGVCAEYQGDYQTALARYRDADARVKPGKDAKMILKSVERVRSAQAASGR